MRGFVVLYPTFRHFRQDSDISDKIPTFAIGLSGKNPDISDIQELTFARQYIHILNNSSLFL
ncbi:hypothetical protein [Microcoleus sp. S36b_A4]|uniref:hypothetical protein n=1 Tax=Microcoleus sp. S36b_A4 TaxID=3055420 RepID=UPI002FCF6F49